MSVCVDSRLWHAYRIWLMAGDLDDVTLFNDVWYSYDGAIWTEATAAAPWSPRVNTAIVPFLGGLFLMGGKTSQGSVNDVWVTSSLIEVRPLCQSSIALLTFTNTEHKN